MPKYLNKLKLLLITALIISFMMTTVSIYKSIQTVEKYKQNQIEMANFILTAVTSSNRLLMSFSRFSQNTFQTFVEELATQQAINNIIIYDENDKLILSFKEDNQIPLNTSIDTKTVRHSGNRLILYSTFKPQRGNGMMQHGGGRKGSIRSQLFEPETTLFIAISLNTDHYNSLRNSEYLSLGQTVVLQLILIAIFIYTLNLIKLFIASQKKLSMAEKEAELAKYSTTLAHEIKNPLSSIGGLVDHVNQQSEDRSIKECLDKARDEVDRLNKIVNDFLQFGKDIQLSPAHIPLHETVTHTLKLVQYDAEAKQITFDMTGTDFQIYADKDRFLQVLLNLFLNAIQASPKNEQILIHTDADRKQISITNAVTASETIDEGNLFQPFYSTKTVGTGLGLAISKKILNLHQYDIQISSVDPFIVIITLGEK